MKIQKHVFGILCGLAVEFVLGMITNLFGIPPEERSATNPEPLFALIATILHALFGLFLLFGAIYTYYLSRKSGNPTYAKSGLYCLIGMILATGGGIATVSLGDRFGEVPSFVMAIGFLVAFIAYGRFHFILKTTPEHTLSRQN